jgi:hypothetical protein
MKTQRDEPYQITKHNAKILTDVVLSQSGYEGNCVLSLTQERRKHQVTTKLLKFLQELTLRHVSEDDKIQ